MSGKAVGLFLVILVLVVGAVVVHVEKPEYYNVFSQALFDSVLVLFSALFSAAVSNAKSETEMAKRVGQTWLPAAENACKQLITISRSAERMIHGQQQACDSLGCFLPEEPTSDLVAARQAIKMQCDESAEKLRTLQAHVENAIAEWEVFIRNNCVDNQCEPIFSALGAWRQKQFSGEFFVPPKRGPSPPPQTVPGTTSNTAPEGRHSAAVGVTASTSTPAAAGGPSAAATT